MSGGLILHTAAFMAIGAQLRAIRLAAKKTQTVLAEELGVDQSLVSNVERGTRATTTDVLERWAKACNAELVFSGGADPLAAARTLPDHDVSLLAKLVGILGSAKDDPFRKAVILGTIEGALAGATAAETSTARKTPRVQRAVRGVH